MKKCPNCGSTAQLTLVDRYKYAKGKIAEEYVCGCGAKLIQHYELQIGILYTDEGAKYIKEDE